MFGRRGEIEELIAQLEQRSRLEQVRKRARRQSGREGERLVAQAEARLRTPEQLLYIGMVWWTSIKERPKVAGRLRAREPVAEREDASREGVAS